MAVDLREHKAVLATVFLAGRGAIELCLDRMKKGVAIYEKPGLPDSRNYAQEAEEEVVDALNYLAMEYVRCYEIDAKRAVLVAAIGNALWQASIGIQNLRGIDEDDA